jgi:hypothetical protein
MEFSNGTHLPPALLLPPINNINPSPLLLCHWISLLSPVFFFFGFHLPLTMMGFRVGSRVIIKAGKLPGAIKASEGPKIWEVQLVDPESGRLSAMTMNGLKSQQMRMPKKDEFPEEQAAANADTTDTDAANADGDDDDSSMHTPNKSSSSEDDEFVWHPTIEVKVGSGGVIVNVAEEDEVPLLMSPVTLNDDDSDGRRRP